VTWGQGRAVVEDMLRRGHLERVPANRNESTHLLTKARIHLTTAAAIAGSDPETAYDALYSAARKALTAILVEQGLRPTREGGHEAAISAVEAQMDPPMGGTLRPYRRLRRRRGQGDYYGAADQVHPDDVALDLPAAAAIVDMAETLCRSGVLTVFTPEIR